MKPPLLERFDEIDHRIAGFMRRHGVRLLRWAMGLVFIWFGALKPLGLSPAEQLVADTVRWAFDPSWAVAAIGLWEVAIGVCMIIRPLVRLSIALLALQMGGTFMPLVMLPQETWVIPGLQPTLAGQYIIKNLVIIAAAIVIGGTVRLDERATGRSL
jgi:uncharacterized membrane protein YkgB